MQFNPTNKAISLIGDIDFLLFGSSVSLNASYSIEDRTRNINIIWDEALTILYSADPNYMWDDTSNSNFPIATVDLTANLDHYTMLDSAQVVHRVRMMDTNGYLRTLEPKLRREFTDGQLRATGTASAYYKIGDAIFPLPIPDYAAIGGVELEFQRGGNHFGTADTDKEAGFNSQFHQFLSIGAALRYALANGMQEKTLFLEKQKTAIAEAMVKHYETRSPDERPKLSIKKRSIKTGIHING